MSFAPVIALLGWLIALFAAAMLAPVLVALGYGETRAAIVFGGTAAVTLFVGIGMIFATQGADRTLRRGGDFLLVVVSWPVLAVFAAAPFYLLDVLATPSDAFFEALSGLTTTGATVIAAIEEQGRAVLFWRAWLQWLGGLATIVLAVSVLPMLGIGGMEVFHGAMPHGDHATLEARVRRSALALSWIYALLTLACAAALWSAGMPGFDALAHALSTLSTGGFSTRDAGIGAFGNPMIEVVLIVFMSIGALNFTLYWALCNGRPGALRRDPELGWLLFLTACATLITVVVLDIQGGLDSGDALRQGLFATISMITTTGHVSGVVEPWPAVLPILFLALIYIGGSSGSTAGGIKVMRLKLVVRQGARELDRLSHPHGVVRIQYGGTPVPERVLQALWSFFILYIVSFAALSVALATSGLDVKTAVAMAMATLTNAGAGLALVAGADASYAVLPDAVKWVLSFGMLLGRLDLITVVAVLTPAFWRR